MADAPYRLTDAEKSAVDTLGVAGARLPKIIAIGASPNGHFALMDDGRLFERIRDSKNFDGRNPDKWIWIERDGPLTSKVE